MITKTLKTTTGKLTISVPSSLDQLTLGQVIELQEKPSLNDIEAISILSGAPLIALQNIKNFDDLQIFGEVILLLSKQLRDLYSIDKIVKQVAFDLPGGKSKVVIVPKNLSVEPAGAFMAAREIIADEISEHIKKVGTENWQEKFNPSLKACSRVLAHYFYCKTTGEMYDEYGADQFVSEIKKLRVLEALPIAKHFFYCYPRLSTPKTGYLNRLRQRWKKKRESALLKSLSTSTL